MTYCEFHQNLALQIESCLGKIISAKEYRSKTGESKFYIAEFKSEDIGYSNIRFFGTIGVSEYVQHCKNAGDEIQQEFVIAIEKGQNCEWVYDILAQICYPFLAAKHAVLRGETIGPYDPIDSSTSLSGFYATFPIFLYEENMTFTVGASTRLISWLIPIYDSEFKFVEDKGWGELEKLMEPHFGSLMRLDRQNFSPPLFKYSDLSS